MGKKEAGEKKRQEAEHIETECCSSAVVQRAEGRKNDRM